MRAVAIESLDPGQFDRDAGPSLWPVTSNTAIL